MEEALPAAADAAMATIMKTIQPAVDVRKIPFRKAIAATAEGAVEENEGCGRMITVRFLKKDLT